MYALMVVIAASGTRRCARAASLLLWKRRSVEDRKSSRNLVQLVEALHPVARCQAEVAKLKRGLAHHLDRPPRALTDMKASVRWGESRYSSEGGNKKKNPDFDSHWLCCTHARTITGSVLGSELGSCYKPPRPRYVLQIRMRNKFCLDGETLTQASRKTDAEKTPDKSKFLAPGSSFPVSAKYAEA